MIDAVIICVYVIVTLIVGYFAGRHVKTMRDFSVSDKAFPTTVLVATIFATWMGGDDLIGVSERIFTVGIIFIIVQWAQFISLAIHAYVIAPKIVADFSDKISVGEIMGALYGNIGQVASGIASVLFSVGYVAVQTSSIGYVCNLFFGISHTYGSLIGSFIIILYSTFGGIRAVVFTDVLQFFVLIIGIPLMASVALNSVGGFEGLISHLPASHISIDTSSRTFWVNVVFFIVCAFPFFNPVLIQRILMAKSAKQASNSLIIAGSLYMPFYAVIAIIALCAVVIFPDTDPNNAFLSILNHSLPPIVKGIAVSGVLAVIMSTADSFLNVSVVSTVRDIAAVLVHKKFNDRQELIFSRFATIAYGIASIFISTWFYSMIDFWLYFSNFWAPTVIAPMILYMFNIKTSIKIYITSVIIGLCSIVVYRNIIPEDFNMISQLFGMSITLICMLVAHKRSQKYSTLGSNRI
ncbi:MAG: sodium:solute symporter family protein [Holosporaceae bacterium]|jgi:SSS family solute:Na+ symporter|nr:sodium:solute symporter family protein [Holosporaceae bacterium]